MSRTQINVPISRLQPDQVFQIMENILVPLGYNRQMYDAEVVWAKGDGFVIQKQCFTALVYSNMVILQSWMKDAIIGETELSGFVAALPKSRMRKQLEALANTISTVDRQQM